MEGLQEHQVEGRVGGWIQTFSGGRIWPLDPRPEEINIQDIAHALGNLCRFGGHVREFYSVAQHSVLISHIVPEELALAGLLHDASEAYLIDVPRPIKYSLDMQAYRDAEARLEEVICERFGLAFPLDPVIKEYDRALLRVEQRDLMPRPPAEWEDLREVSDRYREMTIRPQSPWEAKTGFLNTFRMLERRAAQKAGGMLIN